jgi:hypothetical protein
MSDINDLDIESSITFNLEDCAGGIELYCADYFLPPPKGIYNNTRVEPVMIDGGNYYTVEKTLTGFSRKPVTDLYTVKKGLSVYTDFDSKDVVVVSALQLSNKDKCLSTLPIRPYRGMKVVELLINNQINSFIKYRKGTKGLYDGLNKHLKTDLTDEDFDRALGAVKEQYADTNASLRDFMGKHDWSIYFVKVKGYTIVVQKSMDWRAYDWSCRMESKEWK